MRELEYAGNLCFMEIRLLRAGQSDIGKVLIVRLVRLTHGVEKTSRGGGRFFCIA